MTDPSSSPSSLLGLAIVLLMLYRVGIAILVAAFQALPSVQRRLVLEEESITHPRLAELLEHPRQLGLGLRLLHQLLLAAILVAAWPFVEQTPLGLGALGLLALAYFWLLDLTLPSLVVAGNPVRWLNRFFPIYALPERLLAPLAVPLAKAAERRKAEKQEESADEDATQGAVNALLEEGEAEGILEEQDSALISKVVSFGDTVVREVMTPRTAIKALPAEASLEEAWRAFAQWRHSRIPVFEGGVDHIIGVALLKDLLQLPDGEPGTLRDIVKKPLFVPESKPVAELLRDLQRGRTKLAIVVDEFGSVSGLVTLEDLLEEVFGEIHEEHEGSAPIQETSAGAFLVAGQAHVEDVAAALDLHWEGDGYDTVGGLVMARLGRIPLAGDVVVEDGSRITVLAMEGTRVGTVKVELIRPEPSGE